jgi:hypothetical protein
MRYYGIQNEVKAYLNRLQSETSIQITPSIVKTLNDRVESLKKSGVWSQFGLGFNDTDADNYFQRASVNDVIGRSEVCWFVRGIKSLGLWQNMVSWPLRSYQNAGTGSTVYSLGGGGISNGTMVNSPTWGIDGITFSATSSQTKTDTLGLPPTPFSSIVVGKRVLGTGTASWEYVGTGSEGTRSVARRVYANNSMGISIQGVGYTMLVNTNDQTFTDNIEYVHMTMPSLVNANAEVFINLTKPAQTAGGANWGVNASTGGIFRVLGDLIFQTTFHATFNISINNVNFYNLYKSTLGSNLGLP